MEEPPPDALSQVTGGVERAVRQGRYLMVLPVAVLLLAALGAFVYGTALAVDSAGHIIDHPFPIRSNVGLFVALIDIFLVGATLLIAAFGFYELFVSPGSLGEGSGLPRWLVMRDLDDLKIRVLSMIVLVSATTFADAAVDFHSGPDILYLGAAVALIVAALAVFIRLGTRSHG